MNVERGSDMKTIKSVPVKKGFLKYLITSFYLLLCFPTNNNDSNWNPNIITVS